MSDTSAKAKIAAAKKRFKQLKELKENGDLTKKNLKKSENEIFNNDSASQHIPYPISESNADNLQFEAKPELNVTFTGNSYFSETPVPNADAFFDSIPSQNTKPEQYETLNNFAPILHDTNPFNEQSNSEKSGTVALENPEFIQNEIMDRVNMVTNEDARKLEEYLHQEAQGDTANKPDMDEAVYKNKIMELENCNMQLQQNFYPMQEQLEYHRKTFQILVDEKTDLISQLNEAQGATKQKVVENEDLQGRLRASRSRVADLEKEINCLKSLKNDFERNGIDKLKEYDNLVTEHRRLKENSEELQQISSELQEKFNAQISTNQHLEKDLHDAKSQIEKLHLRLQQLNIGDNIDAVENIREKELTKQVEELQEALKHTSTESEQANKQYQQYVEQLNMQRQNLANRIEALTTENMELGDREQNLIRHIGELEKLLQDKPITNSPANAHSENELRIKLNEAEAALHTITEENEKLKQLCKENETDRICLEQNVQEAQAKITNLENFMKKEKAEQPNMVELLATMESDKVAAARAVTQNNELKKQLEELQEAFVRMSNDKLELTEKLEAEQHYNKEVHEKWKEKNVEVENLRHELLTQKNNSVEMNKQILLQNQLTDRLRHYEAQGHMSDVLQKQVQEYKHTVDTITIENHQLKDQLATTNGDKHDEEMHRQMEELKQIAEGLKSENEMLQNQLLASNSESFIQNIPEDLQQHIQTLRDMAESNKLNFENLLQEYFSLQDCKQKYEVVKSENEKLRAQVADTKTEIHESVHSEENSTGVATIDREHAMEQLEQRFTKMMTDVANLTDEKQRLEHIVLQLQSETETIGEYIALYQYQRAILKEKTIEKDEQLQRLARDREEVRRKLDDLNSLVRQMFINGGKHQISSDILAKHEHLNNQACSEHSHLQEEFNVTKEHPNVISSATDNDNNNEKIETADKIMALLSEIKTSNLVQPNNGFENFNPCPWCSGQLITV